MVKRTIAVLLTAIAIGLVYHSSTSAQIGIGTTNISSVGVSGAGGTCAALGGDLSGTCAAATVAKTSFSAITSGTNTAATMTVGSGAVVNFSGSGQITNPSLGAAASALTVRLANAAVTGTTTNKLVKLSGAPSTAIIATTSDTTKILGICISGCGTTGSAEVAVSGTAACVFDGPTTANDYVKISGATNGNCTDAGSTFPTGVQVIGFVITTNAGAGTYNVWLFGPDGPSNIASKGGTQNGGFIAGSVPFGAAAGGLAENNANFFWGNTDQELCINAGAGCSAELHVKYKVANSGGNAVLIMDNPSGGNATAVSLCHNGGSCTGIQSDISGTNRFGFFTDRANIEFDNSAGAAGSFVFFVNTTGNVKLGASNKFFLNGGQSAIGFNQDPGSTATAWFRSVDDAKPLLRLEITPDNPRGNQAMIEFFNAAAVISKIGPMYKPSDVGTTPATAEADIMNMTGGGGGDTTIATTGVGGIGGAIILTATVGGVANSANTASTGGAGGAITLTTGAGGAASVATGTNVGGAGGTLTLTAGNGGATASGTTNTGGAGGDILLNPGTGGAGATAAGRAGYVQVGGTFRYKSSANVASAATVTLPSGNLFHITGTTNITTLNNCDSNNNGDLVVLIFDGVLTFTDGNNLKLAGNFVTTADDTITLACDGTNWYEQARSIN